MTHWKVERSSFSNSGRRGLLEVLRGLFVPLAGLIEQPFGQGKVHGLDGLSGLLNEGGNFRILR